MGEHDPSVRPIHIQKVTYPIEKQRQFCIVETPLTGSGDGPKHVEYRVYNWRRLSSGRIVRGERFGLGWILALSASLWICWKGWESLRVQHVVDADKIRAVLILLILHFALLSRSKTVLYQSVVPLLGLGLQLSTTRGISLSHPLHPSSPDHRLLYPMSTSYTFIPLSEISTVVINEGLRRWNVRYYLAVIKKGGKVVVALDEVWAPVSVLKEVYHGVRESLFDEYADPP